MSILSAWWAGWLAAVGVGGPAIPAPVETYQWPLAPQPSVVRGFDAPAQVWAPGHRGVDLLGEDGRPVRAAGAGTVAFSGLVAGRPVVAVLHPNGWRTTYEPVAGSLPIGTAVVAGEVIGVLRSTGSHCAPRTCLHWGLVVGPDVYRDPLTLVQPRMPILLPLD